MRMPYSIALEVGTQKGGIAVHLITNFGWNQDSVVRPKKPARNTREYIDRKKENAIFAPP